MCHLPVCAISDGLWVLGSDNFVFVLAIIRCISLNLLIYSRHFDEIYDISGTTAFQSHLNKFHITRVQQYEHHYIRQIHSLNSILCNVSFLELCSLLVECIQYAVWYAREDIFVMQHWLWLECVGGHVRIQFISFYLQLFIAVDFKFQPQNTMASVCELQKYAYVTLYYYYYY